MTDARFRRYRAVYRCLDALYSKYGVDEMAGLLSGMQIEESSGIPFDAAYAEDFDQTAASSHQGDEMAIAFLKQWAARSSPPSEGVRRLLEALGDQETEERHFLRKCWDAESKHF